MKPRVLPKAGRIAAFVCSAMCMSLVAPLAYGQATGCTDQVLPLAEGQVTDTLAYTSSSQFPWGTDPANGNKWTLSDGNWWTSGFFPGRLWQTYENSLNPSWMSRAQVQTQSLLNQDVNTVDHNIGFKIMESYGNGYRITRDPAYMKVIQTAAKSMATLYQPSAGVIDSWPGYDSHITVIVDNMMTLELLFFAAQNGGDPAWRDIAVNHALKTMQDHVRADGSTYHAVDYNTDGTVFSKFTIGGAGTETTWSRGQAWAIYGFTRTYHYTQDSRFLNTAQRLADYFITHLPPDYVPYWDFSQCCTAPRDSSAAAIAAAGLLELSTYVAAQADRDRYRNAALNIQASLSSPAYLGDRQATDGVLLHGSGNVRQNSQIDVSLIFGDYYFIQGCFRAKPLPTAPTNLTATVMSDSQVNLTWDAETGPIRYSVKRSATSGGPYTILAPPPVLTTNQFSDTGVSPGITYYYVVSATNVAGEGPNSAQVSAGTSKAATSTSLISSANPSVYGRLVTFTASVKSASPGTPTGTVTFKDSGLVLGTVALTSGQATLSNSTLGVGSHPITAVYSGSASFAGSTSSVLTETVTKAATSSVVSSSLNPAKYGSSIAFVATVKSSTTGVPSGTVTFRDGSSILGSVTLSSGKATLSRSTLAVGSHSISVVYGGSANFTGSTSSALTETVTKAGTSSVVSSSLNPARYGNSVTFTTTVRPTTSGTPTGTVTFRDGSTILASVALSGGKASLTRSNLTVGSHSIWAVYGGSANYTGSTSSVLGETVTKAATSSSVTSSLNPSRHGNAVTFTATVKSSTTGTPTGTVTFRDGGTSLGSVTLSSGRAALTKSTLTVGSHSITVVYGGSSGFYGSTSPALTQQVNP